MGSLIDGRWHAHGDNKVGNRRFTRADSSFREWVTPVGEAGPEGRPGRPATSGRYRLYVSYSCPWAHRTLIMRTLKGLTGLIPISVAHWLIGEEGWTFQDEPGVVPDPVHQLRAVHELYAAADPHYTGRATVPLLWDVEKGTIVNNESSEIIRMLNTGWNDLGACQNDYYPQHLRDDIDALNERIYDGLNHGVYRAGFTTSQEAYDEAVHQVFGTLDWLEEHLSHRRFLIGDQLTEADVRLFPTLIRFDAVYHHHFKCNLRRLADYPALSVYTREFYRRPGIAETVDFSHIRRGYYQSHAHLNPSGIVPAGPILDFDAALCDTAHG